MQQSAIHTIDSDAANGILANKKLFSLGGHFTQ